MPGNITASYADERSKNLTAETAGRRQAIVENAVQNLSDSRPDDQQKSVAPTSVTALAVVQFPTSSEQMSDPLNPFESTRPSAPAQLKKGSSKLASYTL